MDTHDLPLTARAVAGAGEVIRARELVGVDFSGADLRNARFEQCRFSSCNFARADLRGAAFILCTLQATALRDVVLGDNRFYGTELVAPLGLSDEAQRTIERRGGIFRRR